MKRIQSIIVSILPSKLKIYILRKLGFSIGNNSYIGFLAILDCANITIGDNVYISGFNLIHRIQNFVVESYCKFDSFNWITGGGTGSFSIHNNSAITRFHFFEASGNIEIGDNSIIAGRGSHFFTHGLAPHSLNDVRSIEIGPWCYIGSSSRFAPGSSIAKATFVGMGSVVVKKFETSYILIGGSPAKILKNLSPKDKYFDRKYIFHSRN